MEYWVYQSELIRQSEGEGECLSGGDPFQGSWKGWALGSTLCAGDWCRWENHILPSLPLYHSFRALAITLSLTYCLNIFGLRNPWEPELYTIRVRSLRIQESLILIIIPNGDIILALNSPDPYDSNGATYMCIHARYKEIQKLPGLCLHLWRKLDRRDMLRIIYR